MARKKKAKKLPAMRRDNENLPTLERMVHGGISIRNNTARADNPLRIDKLLANGVIDEMQHLYGIQIITFWTIASRPFIKAMQYEQRHLMRLPDFNAINVTRMSAEDMFHKVMSFLRPRERELIERICFKEQGAIEAGRGAGIAINSITAHVRHAFDALGDALAKARGVRREIERRETAKAKNFEPV